MQDDWNIILSVVDSPDSSLIGQQKVFSASPITIGRGEDNDLFISDPTISRKHSIIRITNDYTRVFITDQSTYGTEVDGTPVPKGPGSGFTLTDGCSVKLGNTELRFELKLKLSVQSTFIGQNIDRSFLDGPAPDSIDSVEKPVEEEIEEPIMASVSSSSSQQGFNPVFVTVIAVLLALLVWIIFFV